MKGLMLLLLGIFITSNAFAISGVSPASFEVDFEPNLEKEFVFDFVIDGEEFVEVSIEGALRDYFQISNNEIKGRQKVIVNLKLPEALDSRGINEVVIKAGDVRGLVRINVPDPNGFIELDLRAPDVNIGEIVDIELDVLNKGDLIKVLPILEIYKVGNKTEEILNIINLKETFVLEKQSFGLQLDTSNYSAGNYFVRAIVEFDDEFKEEKNTFRIGEKRVELLNYTKGLEENKVAKFELDVVSFWNSDIEDLYAEIQVVDSNYSFVTTATKLRAFERIKLEGFIDGKEIYDYDKELKIILHYDGAKNEEIVPFEIIKGFDFILLVAILLAVIIVGFLVWRGKVFLDNIREVKE